MHEVLVNYLGGLSLPRKSVVRLTDRTDMTLDVYRGRKTTIQQQQHSVTMPILAMHLIGRCNWNGKCYACSIPVPKSREVLQFVNTVY